MKKFPMLLGILLSALLPCMAVGQGVQPLYPAMPPTAPGAEMPGMGPQARYPGGPMGTANRQLVPLSICKPTTGVPFNVSAPYLAPGFEIHAGLLLLQPSADNLGWAVLTNVLNPASPVPVASPFWSIQTLKPNYQAGFEVGASYAFCSSGNDAQVNWQHLSTKTSNSAGAIEGEQWISPFSQTGPSSAQSFNDLHLSQGVNRLRSAEGRVEFDYDVVNLDFGQYVNVGCSMQARMFAGLSYANLEERLVSSFYGVPDPNSRFPPSVPVFISLSNTTSYAGVGPRFGLDTAYAIPYGLRFTGQVAGALLIGRAQPSQYLFTATAPDLDGIGIAVNHEQVGSKKFTQVVYSCDARLGIGCSLSAFSFEGGYMAALYVRPFSGYETNHNVLPLQIGSLSTASMRHTLSNFTVHGIYLTGGIKW